MTIRCRNVRHRDHVKAQSDLIEERELRCWEPCCCEKVHEANVCVAMLTAATRGKTCQAAVKSRAPKLNWNASLHNQGLMRLLEKGAGVATCNRFLDAGGDVGETLQVERMFPAKLPAEGSLRNSSMLKGWCCGWFDNGIPGGKREAGNREGMFDALHM